MMRTRTMPALPPPLLLLLALALGATLSGCCWP